MKSKKYIVIIIIHFFIIEWEKKKVFNNILPLKCILKK